MLNVLNKIIEKNKNIFGMNTKYEKINVGFTNSIYCINDVFIVKICTNINNETNFLKEINFYNTNKRNKMIPKLIKYDINKKEVPFLYEIIEKIEGQSLYNIWHKLTHTEREDTIKQLCYFMKNLHSNISGNYDWINYFKVQYMDLYSKVIKLNIFNENELELLNKAYAKFDLFLESNKFVLIHNDLHFDNIIYNNGKIKVIDFERTMFAPIDYELDILYRMIKKPWKFASIETEKYVKTEDYNKIIIYIKKYYSEMFSVPNLQKRLDIYDLIYCLKQLINYPDNLELKNDIMLSIKDLIE